jgi:hypothetical protein
VIQVAFLLFARVVKWQTRTFEGRMPKGMGVQVPPRAGIQIYKWLILNILRCKTLGEIQNLVPHRLMSRLKSETTPGDPDAGVTGIRG